MSAVGGTTIIQHPLYIITDKKDALNLAAWLVACADDGGEFEEILKAVRTAHESLLLRQMSETRK